MMFSIKRQQTKQNACSEPARPRGHTKELVVVKTAHEQLLMTLPTELRGRTEKVGDDLDGESRRRESKGTYECRAA